MDAHGWLMPLITPARTLDGRPTRIVVGLTVEAGNEQLQFAIRIDDDATAVLQPEASLELSSHITHVIRERLRREAER
jgi:hypothetical protein